MYAALFALLPLLATSQAKPIRRNEVEGSYIYSGRDGLCITPDVPIGQESTITDGTPVVSKPCSEALAWDVSQIGDSGSIFVHGNFQYALDAGSNPGDHGSLHTWQSYPGLFQQTWFLTGDNRIAITGGNQCLDEGTNGIQTYQCTTGDTNQVFYLSRGTPPTSTVSPTSTPTPTPTTTTTSSPTPTQSNIAQQIHPGDHSLCVGVEGGSAYVGAPVAIVSCADTDSQFTLFDLPANTPAGEALPGNIMLHSDNTLCLDAGDNPSDGSGIKVWTCYEGLTQQTWLLEDLTLSLAQTQPPQCLDVTAGSGPDGNGGLESLQTWACSNNMDPQQYFAIF